MTQRIFNRCAGLITAYIAVIFGLYLQMTPFYDMVALADGFHSLLKGAGMTKNLVGTITPPPPQIKKG